MCAATPVKDGLQAFERAERERARSRRRWNRACLVMALLAPALSLSDLLTPGGASLHGQLGAGTLLAGAGWLWLENRRVS